MILANLEASLGVGSRAILRGIRLICHQAPVDILKVSLYRPRHFGRPFCTLAHELMRGKSAWTRGEREILGAFVSTLNQCVY
jgi:hypothetical protein